MSNKPTYEDLEKKVEELEANIQVLTFKNDFNLFTKFMPDMICTFGYDLKIMQVNPAWQETLGWSLNDLIGKNYTDFVHPDDIEKTKNVCKQSKAKGVVVFNFENRYRCKDNSYKWLSWYAISIPDQKYSFGIARDITKQKEVKEQLQESENSLECFIDNFPGVAFISDPGKCVLYANKILADIYGLKHEEIIGLDFKKYVYPDLYTKVIEQDRIVVEENRTLWLEESIPYKSCLTEWITCKFPIVKKLKPTLVGGFGIDITERKLLEEQLRQAHKMEAIGTLAGGIAHDFNNMLGVILGNAELAMDDVPEWNPAMHNLEEIKTAGLRSQNVVKQLLNFSKKTNTQRKPVSISPIIKESLKFLRSSIPTNIEIRRNIPEEPSIISADPTQIQQIMMNLCTNAAHAMSEDGGIMGVSLSVIEIGRNEAIQNIELNQGQYVNITVSDTGHGMAKEHLDKIFDPYYTTKEVGKGSGIGLSVVHGIVNSHNGAISVDSECGKGTTFNVFLPVVEKEPPSEEKTDTSIPTGNERILIVDDEESIANVTGQMLERLGYIVTARTSSMDTLETFRTRPDNFDLIISDMAMPEITGDKLAKELQKIRPDIPIILCTGYSDRINDEKAKSIGVSALVMKPIVKNVLAKTIRKVLD